ncbi:hypothetical protein PC9H_005480 [Pleurotus ostreatus]|uniref:Uncharacterized protein n=1 Tax=Pleurotus ostreatus TaxID=5322 RepID=A0A8H7DUE9_PLEOS|nr:uncharacterized protein PC9H_005480 [Pleurotus ostreatus]KAF7433524.1 hypothetical protein PC9H_005480 [Pleurotus ostreatus]KAJ8697761.1 hypothetical protein PTI98_004533 [Pleurotus ostreatus]
MSSVERSKKFGHCFACFFQLETDDCQSCKHKPQNGTSAKKAPNLSKDPPPQNTGNPPTQDKPLPHNTSPAPSDPSTPTQPFTTVPKPSDVASSNSPSSHSSPSSSPVEGVFGTSKAPIPTGSESHPITNITGSAPVTQSPSTQTSASTNATPSSVKANEHLATILGVVCGVLSFLLLCLAFWFFLRQRSRRRQRRDSANNWQWFQGYDKWKDVYSPSVKGSDLPDYGRVESGEHRRSPEMWGESNRRLTQDNLEILERHSSRTSSVKSHNMVGSGQSSNSQHTLPTSSKRRDLKRVFSMGALTHTTGTTSKSALVIALPPESHPKETQGSSPSSKILQLLRTYDPVQSRTGSRSPGQIRNTF